MCIYKSCQNDLHTWIQKNSLFMALDHWQMLLKPLYYCITSKRKVFLGNHFPGPSKVNLQFLKFNINSALLLKLWNDSMFNKSLITSCYLFYEMVVNHRMKDLLGVTWRAVSTLSPFFQPKLSTGLSDSADSAVASPWLKSWRQRGENSTKHIIETSHSLKKKKKVSHFIFLSKDRKTQRDGKPHWA